MINSTNMKSKLAVTLGATLGAIAMLAIGGVTPSLADSNDGGPFNYTPQGNRSVRLYAPVYPGAGGYRQINPTPNAYESYGRALGPDSYGRQLYWVPGPAIRQDFPTGAQGGR
jgi:hypothetical protein